MATNYKIIIRQINTSGEKGIWAQFNTTDKDKGRAWIAMNFQALNTDDTCPKVQTVGNGRVPVICQVFKT